MQSDIEKIIITEEQIKGRLKELVSEVMEYYVDKPLVVIAILKGSVIFLADFIRLMPIKMSFDFITLSSYGNSSVSSGKVQLDKDIRIDIKNKYVLLIDDIYDSGHTFNYAKEYLVRMKPAEIRTCAFIVKKKKRQCDVSIDYSGFEIEDRYVVGYGLDYMDLYRNLPYVAVIDPRIISDNSP